MKQNDYEDEAKRILCFLIYWSCDFTPIPSLPYVSLEFLYHSLTFPQLITIKLLRTYIVQIMIVICMIVNCGVVAGPNSEEQIAIMMETCRKLSRNQLRWYVCIDSKFSTQDDFEFLCKDFDVVFTEPIDGRYTSSGDRHGRGCDILIRETKNQSHLILSEPDIRVTLEGWDDYLLSKLEPSHIISTSMEYRGDLDIDFNRCGIRKIIHPPASGSVIFMAVKPSILTKLGATFMKIKIPQYGKSCDECEKMGDRRSFHTASAQARVFGVPEGQHIFKETGWRLAYLIGKSDYNSHRIVTYMYMHPQSGFDLMFTEDDRLLAVHLKHSRLGMEWDMKSAAVRSVEQRYHIHLQ